MEQKEEEHHFEIAIAVPKRKAGNNNGAEEKEDCLEVLVKEFKKAGFIVETVPGLSDGFIKLAAPLETMGRVAAELKVKKPTHIGVDLQFDLEEIDAFVRQPDDSLFSWCERFLFYHHLIDGIVNKTQSTIILKNNDQNIQWEAGESLVRRLELENIIKQVFPLHVETTRKKLLRAWALNWWDLTTQPIDDIYSYFGAKRYISTQMAIYFAFLGMYTSWMLFPAVLGVVVQFVNFGPFQFLVLPVFFICIVLWAVMFSQFWKRKNAALLSRWQISNGVGAHCDLSYKSPVRTRTSLQSSVELFSKWGRDQAKFKELYQREEWLGTLMRFRNDALIILSIICLQLPFELAYAHLYEILESGAVKFGLTAIYLLLIQYFTRLGGRVAVQLISYESNANKEYRADSLVYKVFGVYFMQSYIGLFYHVLLHRNFMTLREVLVQRLIVSEVLENLWENSMPYLKYSYKKYKVRKKTKLEKRLSSSKLQFKTRVEKEYLKPTYSASIGDEFEDGLFDDFLELTLQFGMIMMFACAYPLAFAFAALNNVTEIRTDALKLLVMMKRPVPRDAATIGAWLNIFQFLLVMSICTNSVLLVCLYDQEGKWKIEPGLAAILVMEHILLLIKFGFSRFVPEEPAWVRANRVKNAAQAHELYSKQLLRSISGSEKVFAEDLKRMNSKTE